VARQEDNGIFYSKIWPAGGKISKRLSGFWKEKKTKMIVNDVDTFTVALVKAGKENVAIQRQIGENGQNKGKKS